jgi:pimeloyl-ACP methyl ester carboxylesterase
MSAGDGFDATPGDGARPVGDGTPLLYLPGIAGHPASSPVLDALAAVGWDVVVPTIPGLDGRSGFHVPEDYLSWLVVVWDALDATGALPCPVVGASLGGMLAADLAVLRPEAVTALALLAPFGIFDDAHPGLDLYAVPTADRMSHLFAKGVPEPFVERFADLGPEDGPVARYLCDVAAANLLWPLGDRGHARRLHRVRCPALVLWGDQDELLPVATSEAWSEHGLPVEVVPGAGHLLEWDEPDTVASRLVEFVVGLPVGT